MILILLRGEDIVMERRNDYVLDMVEDLSRGIMKLITKKSDDNSETIVVEALSDKDKILVILRKLISERRYSEAENFLFKICENNEEDYVESVGLWFYKELSLKSEEELAAGDFSKEEIEQGLKDFQKLIE